MFLKPQESLTSPQHILPYSQTLWAIRPISLLPFRPTSGIICAIYIYVALQVEE